MPYQPGESGNPNGRPKGTGHRQQLFNDTIMPHKEALIAKAIELAMNGNEQMLKLLLDRILPAKPTDDPITLRLPEDKISLQSFHEVGDGILRSLAQGNITPTQAKFVFDILKGYRENSLIEDLRKQFQWVMEKLKNHNPSPYANGRMMTEDDYTAKKNQTNDQK